MIRVVVPQSEFLKRDTIQTPAALVETFRNFCKTQGLKVGVELLDFSPEDLDKHLRGTPKPFDVFVSISKAGMLFNQIPFFKKHNIRVISFWDDLHWYTEKDRLERQNLFDLSSLILLPYFRTFSQMKSYQNFWAKARWFPWFAPTSCFQQTTPWANRNSRMLVSGNIGPRVYPLRTSIWEYAKSHPELFSCLAHPGYILHGKPRAHEIVGDSYYQHMGQFQGAVVTGGIPPSPTPRDPIHQSYLVSKYFEAPACGCLSFFEDDPELQALGFIPQQHYIPINRFNFNAVLSSQNLLQGERIAEAGREHTLKHHSVEVRCKQLLGYVVEQGVEGCLP